MRRTIYSYSGSSGLNAKAKQRRMMTTRACLLVAGLAGGGEALAEPSARDQITYDTLFRDKVIAVERSRGIDDDVELIRQMFETAQAIPDDPGVQQLIYRGVMRLGESAGQFESVVRAVELLRSAAPDDPAVEAKALQALFEKGYRSARGEDRVKVGGMYVDVLMELAQAAAGAEDAEAAAKLYEEARLVARANSSPREQAINDAVDRLAQAQLLNTRIAQLERAVRSNPQNQSAARDLVMLLLIDKDAPERAAEFAEQTQDPDLADVVRFAARGVEGVSAPQALRLGDWYFAQAREQEGERAYQMYGRAVAYYDAMLGLYPREDALRQRVVTMRGMAGQELDKLQAQRLGDQAGQWVDLIAMFDAKRHGLGENVGVRNQRIYTASTGFVLPTSPDGNYDLRMSFDYVGGERGMVLSLPISEWRLFDLHYSWDADQGVEVKWVKDNDDPQLMLRPGKQVQMEVQVRPGEESNSVRVLIDGVEVVLWEGDRKTLTTDPQYRAPDPFAYSIGVTCGGQFIFRSIQIRELPE